MVLNTASMGKERDIENSAPHTQNCNEHIEIKRRRGAECESREAKTQRRNSVRSESDRSVQIGRFGQTITIEIIS